MRFSPEHDDPDNAGLSIIMDLLHDVKKAHPGVKIKFLITPPWWGHVPLDRYLTCFIF